MTSLVQKLAKLTPEKRALLEGRLNNRPSTSRPEISGVARSPADRFKPLSFSQERLWFLEQLEGVSATYNICSATRLKGVLNIAALEHALTEIVRRHEVLRTTFPNSVNNESAGQRILQKSPFWESPVDLSEVSPDAREPRALELLSEFACQEMALGAGPLFRTRIIRLSDTDYVFAVLMHHIISDGWSFEIFFRELSVLYADFLAGRESSLPPLKVQYSDFAHWQRQRLDNDEITRHINYWKTRLSGVAPLLELPADFARPAKQTYSGSYVETHIGAVLTEKIRQVGREADATLFMTLLAAFQGLLYRQSSQPDIVVGCPVTNRNRVELEPLIGFFVNMLPMRTNFSDDPTARELIRRVGQTTAQDLCHQELPFEKMVLELQPERSLGHAPFFQVAFMFQQEDSRILNLEGLVAKQIPVCTATAKYDLTLYVAERSDGLRLGLEFADDLFTAETARGILAQWECLLVSIVSTPDLAISQLSILPPDQKQVLEEWNRTNAPYPKTTLHALCEQQSALTPDAVAVEFNKKRLTYRELDEWAQATAEELRRGGVTEGVRVGVFINRSLEMIVTLLGILKAGGAYVPLDPSFPADRLAFMIEDAQLSVLVTEQALLKILPPHHSQVICIDLLDREPQRIGFDACGNPDALAYLIYTSGSTGHPKGIEITHRSVVNLLEAMRREPGIDSTDVLLSVTTLSFDIAGLELFLPLVSGARLVIAPREMILDGRELAGLIRSSSATVMQATPATWRLLLESGWEGSPNIKILCGGESLPPEIAKELLSRCGELWNMYGPTETTIWSTVARITSPNDIPVGKPIANTQTYVVNGNSQQTPIGIPGELLIAGDGLAIGYFNRSDITVKSFIPNPFKPGSRLYRTGDLAKYRHDGNLVVLGRMDSQVKLRGYRIELGEIEFVMGELRDIKQAVAAIVGEQLIAYFTTNSGKPIDSDKYRELLRTKLPDYMVPARFVHLESIPLTPNGKVDRKALPTPSRLDFVPSSGPVRPRTETEAKLADIWGLVLGLNQVGVTEDFFALGGHSLLAVKLFAEIERRMGVRLPLATLFAAATVERLARQIQLATSSTHEWSSLVSIQPLGTKPVLYCVHGAGGNVLLYRDLSQALGTDFPLYGFQSKGLDGCATPLTTIEEMALHYVSELRTIQPRGPYHLAGYCLGGMIAYQMARLLANVGEKVELVALLDCYNPAEVGKSSRIAALWQRAKFHAGNFASLRPTQMQDYLREKIRVLKDGELDNILGSNRTSTNGDASSEAAGLSDGRLQVINDRATELFRPEPYDGSIVLFRPRVNYDFLPDPLMGWGGLVRGGFDIVELRVNPHAMLVKPFVDQLATELKPRIQINPGVSSHSATSMESASIRT